MSRFIENPYSSLFTEGVNHAAKEILEIVKARIHSESCDCYGCVELRACIEDINDALGKDKK